MAELHYNIGKEESIMSMNLNKTPSAEQTNATWNQDHNRIVQNITLDITNAPGIISNKYPISFKEKTIFITVTCPEHPELDQYLNAFFMADCSMYFIRIIENPYVNTLPKFTVNISATGF